MPLDHLLGSVFKFSTIGRIPGVGPGSNKMEMCSPYSFQKLILYHSSFPPILSTILKKISKSVLSLCGIRKWKWKWKSLIHGRLFATPWTVACQASLAMEFSRQESLSGLPFISPGDLPDPEIELRSPALQAGSLPSESPGKPICGIRSMGKVGHRGRNSSEFSPTCWGPAPADPGYSKERWRRWGSGNNCLIKH